MRGQAILCALTLVLAAVGPTAAKTAPPPRKLLIISVDGLDWRYLRDRDAMGMSIPNLKALISKGETADGVVGVWPTITWPSHTSIVTGVRPDQHGVLSNAARGSPFDTSYWSVKVLKAEPLWNCAASAGRTTATVTWPVTLDARVTYNLPEVFARRNGGSMDLAAVAAHATPGLVEEITRAYPSFAQQWVDDRTRTQATLFLLRTKRPDLVLVHLVDLDSEEHDQGPFDTNAKAILERSDELIGEMRRALPKDYDIVVTSDHGFERLDRIAQLRVAMATAGIEGDLKPMGGLVATSDPQVADYLRKLSAQPDGDVGREIPHTELIRYAPNLSGAVAAFEPRAHVMFGPADKGPEHTDPPEKGEHGFWPRRIDYRSVYIHDGAGVKAHALPELEMVDLHDRLAQIIGVHCPRQF